MGLKTDSHPTNSRSAKMNPRDLKIKQIVETTRCTHSEAEEALQENNNELEAAVSWILDHNGDNVWSEPKGRKSKKAEAPAPVEEQRPERPPRGESNNRRGGRRGGGTSRGASNSVSWKPGQVFTRTEQPTSKSSFPASNTFESASANNGYVASVTNNSAAQVNASSAAPVAPKPAVIKTAAGPMSFAAVCAAGGKKPDPPQPVPVPSSSAAKQSTPATTPHKPVQSPHVATPSTVKESSPAPQEIPIKASPSVSKPEPVTPEAPADRYSEDKNSAKALTSQLKNDLGLGSTTSKNVSSPTLISTSVSPAAPTRGTVEFVSDLHTNNSYDFHFGFNPESTVDESSFKSSNNAASGQNDFNRSRTHENDVYNKANVDSSSASKPLASAVSQLSNSYGIQPQQQSAPASQQQQPRRTAFGYAETSTVSYPPETRPAVNATPAAPATTTPALPSYTKPAVTAQSSYSAHPQQVQQQPPIHQQHTTQQQMYNPMYGAYPYVNLYSPVAGREDNPYAPFHMPYAAYGMDVNSMAQMLPMSMQPAVPSHHQQQQPAHRADHHQNFNEMNKAYGQTAAANPNASNPNAAGQRENIGSSNVPPPPGFSGPPANMFHGQHLQNMFHYPATMYMPKMSNQMYGQQNTEDDRQAKMYAQQEKYANGSNVRDRMAMGNTAQPTPPPAQGTYGQQNSYAANGQMNSVLNSQKKPYHTGQWNS